MRQTLTVYCPICLVYPLDKRRYDNIRMSRDLCMLRYVKREISLVSKGSAREEDRRAAIRGIG